MTTRNLARAIAWRATRAARRWRQRWRDARFPSAREAPCDSSLARLLPAGFGAPDAATLTPIVAHYLAHRFDLLGSGWVAVHHGMEARGIEGIRWPSSPAVHADPAGDWLRGRVNPANLADAQRVWRLVDAEYTPIDWQLDFKSGYRWSERTWYRDIRYGDQQGADVKVPWELSRMQHLCELAVAFSLSREDALPREFRNQVLDWISTNPVRFGVNWTTTMDVAIRAANWLVAYDLFRSAGVNFDAAFDREFARSIVAHGQHIVENLEWSERGAANHYLANVGGLLVIAAYLRADRMSDAWLAFGIQQLISEVKRQFLPDGAHFEASTSYHCLCTEIVISATALVLALSPKRLAALDTRDRGTLREGPGLCGSPIVIHPCPDGRGFSPFPDWYFERLQRAVDFTRHATNRDGRLVQIGDNDSGRFLRIRASYLPWSPSEATARFANLHGYEELSADGRYWQRDDLDRRELVAWGTGLFGQSHLTDASSATLAADVSRLVGAVHPISFITEPDSRAGEFLESAPAEFEAHHTRLSSMPGVVRRASTFRVDSPDLRSGLELAAYPNFGMYVFRSERVHLVLRCGGIRHDGSGGHAHNDQLMIELMVDGQEIGVDPGSYLYSPLPTWRNAYRSVHAHPAPACAQCEPAPLDAGLFRLAGDAEARCLHWTEAGFVGTASVGCGTVTRCVNVQPSVVKIVDYYMLPHAPRDASIPAWMPARAVTYSNGYGVRRA